MTNVVKFPALKLSTEGDADIRFDVGDTCARYGITLDQIQETKPEDLEDTYFMRGYRLCPAFGCWAHNFDDDL